MIYSEVESQNSETVSCKTATMALSERISTLVDQWLSLDPNPETRKEITDIRDAKNEKELEARLGSRISFGTAGPCTLSLIIRFKRSDESWLCLHE